jgi:hypothetical protein
MKKINNYYRKQFKGQLRNYCEQYIKKYDAGENPWIEFNHILHIVKKLDGQWAEKKLN